MMSRAYWMGLIPRSLSSVRSQPSRVIPNRRATDSISRSISARRDLQLLAPQGLVDQRAVDQQLEDLLAFTGQAFIGELLSGDALIVDNAIGSPGFTGIRTAVRPGTLMSLTFTLAGTFPWYCGLALALGAGGGT